MNDLFGLQRQMWQLDIDEGGGRDGHCVQRRCALCCLVLQPGDVIVVGPHWSTRLRFSVDGFHDYGHSITYSPCEPPCDHPMRLAVPCHVDCDRLVSGGRGRLLPISTLTFEPRSSLERRRQGRLRDRLARSLTVPLPGALPWEVRWEVAQYLIQQYAATVLRSLTLRELGTVFVDLFATTAVRYGPYEGMDHVCHVDDNHAPGDADPPRLAVPATLHVAQSPWGIVDVIISHDKTPPPASVKGIPDIWWTSLYVVRRNASILVHSDGYKVRSLIHGAQSTRHLPLFSSPQLVDELRREAWSHFEDGQPLQMRTLRYNFEGIRGLSICCQPEPRDFHLHVAGEEEDLSFYGQTTSPSSVWIYIPLAPGERIVAIWKRGRRSSNSDLALGLVVQSEGELTGRFVVAGAQGTHRLFQLEWTLVDEAAGGKESSLLYDSQPYGIRELMFSSAEPAESARERPPTRSQSAIPSPKINPSDGFLYSSAPLRGVSALRQCRRRIEDRWEVMGLLLMYDDGAVSSVGHVRWDALDETMPVVYTDSLWLAFKCTAQQGYPYIAEARLSQAEDASQWFQLSWRGSLEWWCSYRQCQIRFEGRTSEDIA